MLTAEGFAKIPAMFTVKGIDHVVVRVTNLEGAVSFYRDVLGCSVDRVREELGLVHMRAGSTLIDLISVGGKLGQMGGDAPAPRARNMDHLCLRIEPFDEEDLRSHLSAHGVEAGEVQMNYGSEGDGPSLYVSDPEGNVVELKGPAAV
jgi:catechol 2,3-dioxygenase-like lactoylglutathione lyase family enzyme